VSWENQSGDVGDVSDLKSIWPSALRHYPHKARWSRISDIDQPDVNFTNIMTKAEVTCFTRENDIQLEVDITDKQVFLGGFHAKQVQQAIHKLDNIFQRNMVWVPAYSQRRPEKGRIYANRCVRRSLASFGPFTISIWRTMT